MAGKNRKLSAGFGCSIAGRLGLALILLPLGLSLGTSLLRSTLSPTTLLPAALFPSAWAQAPESASALSKEAAASAAGKFQRILDSSDRGESFGTLRLNEAEINSFIRYDLAQEIPSGVSKVALKLQPGRTHGTAEVDFDRLRQSMRTPPNPLIALFLTGIHELGVEGTVSGANGSGEFHLESVTLDSATLPEPVVEYLIDHYLRTRYPAVAINQPFRLPFSIEQLVVETGSVRLTARPMSATTNGKRLHSGL
jgi:hypothetical protein